MILRHLFLAALLGLAASSSAVHLRVHGIVTDHTTREPLSGVLVRVYKDGAKIEAMPTGDLGHWSVPMENNAEYVVRFSMPGRVTKCFAIDTHGGEWEGDNKEVDLVIEMTLFERVEGLDLTFFDLPMGMGHFDPLNGFLTWNQEYEQNIRPEVDRLMAEVALRRSPLTEMAALAPRKPHR